MKDPYLYDDVDVLINKLNIKDNVKLDEYENRMTTLAIISIYKNEMVIESSMDIFEIHKRLFLEVYEWAGKQRTINMQKQEPILNGLSVIYSEHRNIISELKKVDKVYFSLKWAKLSKLDFMHYFTRMISEIWQIHAFREGNTRSVSTLAFLFLKQYGYTYDANLIKENAKYFRNALVMASIGEYSEYEHLQEILMDAINNKKVLNQQQKYSKIKDYNVNEYKYDYHKLKK